MPHIPLSESTPGIAGLLEFRPEMADPLTALAETLLRGSSPLSRGERELIATVVSHRNECRFCRNSHGAVARKLLHWSSEMLDEVLESPDTAPISEKIRTLIRIAWKVQRDGRSVSEADISRARDEGADDTEIHDTVLIAAAFCMYNRYVDGLAAVTPEDQSVYDAIGTRLAENGYSDG
jgi:uncharacterized peroxidase-related enzyme